MWLSECGKPEPRARTVGSFWGEAGSCWSSHVVNVAQLVIRRDGKKALLHRGTVVTEEIAFHPCRIPGGFSADADTI